MLLTIAETAPITTLSPTFTNPHAGVIATNPTTAPTHAPIDETLFPLIASIKIHATIADAAAVLVVAKAFTDKPFAAKAEPALNPNHPNHSKPVPIITKGMFEYSFVRS